MSKFSHVRFYLIVTYIIIIIIIIHEFFKTGVLILVVIVKAFLNILEHSNSNNQDEDTSFNIYMFKSASEYYSKEK